MYPPQPPGGPYQGEPGPYPPGGPPPAQSMPGTAITVRVLMFVGGACGLLLGLLMWGVAGLAAGGGDVGREILRGMQENGLPLTASEAGVFFGIMGLIPFVYGVLSIVLASLMGRRSAAILWTIVVFHILAALILLFSIVTGGFGAIVPLLFAIGMIVLMLLPITRAYYGLGTAGAAPPGPGAH